MLKKILVFLFIISGIVSSFANSNNLPTELYGLDCLSINQNTDALVDYIDDGTFRESLDVDSQLLPEFSYDKNIPFIDYIHYASQVVALKKPFAQLPCPLYTDTYKVIAMQNNWSDITKVKHLVSPFELQQAHSNKAILLIHGLTDSPYLFHDLAYFYYQQGFNVRTLLLPGHGTSPSDLMDVDYHDWQTATAYAIERTLLDYEQVYLGGFSTGGALIFDYLINQPLVSDKITGLMMWAPASKAKSELAWLAGYIDYLPFVNWVDKDADIDFAKYESFPFNAGAQVHALMSEVTDAFENDAYFHDIPLFVVASEHDQTISTEATIKLINLWHSAKNNEKDTATTLYYLGESDSLTESLAASVTRITPICQQGICLMIHDVAHTATTNSPENPHYGVAGQYRNCGHYISELEQYLSCKTSRKIAVGEVTPENLAKHKLMQRLTYNPYYQDMLAAITTFIRQTSGEH